MNRLLYDKELKGLIYERNRMKELLEATNIEPNEAKKALEQFLEIKKQEISDKLNAKDNAHMIANIDEFIKKILDLKKQEINDKLNPIDYNSYMNVILNEFIEKLGIANNELSDSKKIIEKLLEVKEKEISDKLQTIEECSYMGTLTCKFINMLFEQFIGGGEWKKSKDFYIDHQKEKSVYYIDFNNYFNNYPFPNRHNIFIRELSRSEYIDTPLEMISIYFYKWNDNAKEDIDKLEPISSDFPSYVEDFMNDIIMWRIENKKTAIPEEKLEEIYNNIVNKYLDKERSSEILLELKKEEEKPKRELGINKILYEQVLKENETTNIESSDERESLEKLLEVKNKEIRNKIGKIKYFSLMTDSIYHYIEKLFKHFIGGYEWRVKKRCVKPFFERGTYWISFGDHLLENPQEFFIKYIESNEYYSPASPESLSTNFYKLNRDAKNDIAALEPISEFPSYVEDFMNDIIMWRIENKSMKIPEEKLEEIYNNIIEKYSLNKENTLKRVK